VDVLAPLQAFYPELGPGVLSHHERWDGTGYPGRLAGAAIPLAARIVAIADSFDAITFTRRYQSGRSATAAFDIIGAGRGEQFDPGSHGPFPAPTGDAGDPRRDARRHAPPGT
jgi:HD-GYP domain-containing protein (c-di-GMP phosphodiesterase class II)